MYMRRERKEKEEEEEPVQCLDVGFLPISLEM
jgi:hypothetical protein